MKAIAYVDLALSRIYRDYRQLGRYFGIGVFTTLFDWAIFFVLNQILGIFYMLGLAGSYLASTVLSYFLNRRFTFENNYGRIHLQLASFVGIAILGLGLNEALMYGFVNMLFGSDAGWAVMVSRVIATLMVFLWNFLLNKSITFRVFR